MAAKSQDGQMTPLAKDSEMSELVLSPLKSFHFSSEEGPWIDQTEEVPRPVMEVGGGKG